MLLVMAGFAHAQDAPEIIEDNDTSPYHIALLDYKAGKYQEAYDVMAPFNQGSAPSNPVQFYVLESKVLTELKRYEEGEKLLHSLLTPTGPLEVQLALGDLLLRKRSFDRAAKYYDLALQAKPADPDITLKLIYAKIGSADLVTAGELASHLMPFDPKNPYDAHASYYFAKAALAQATGRTADADEDIESARTFYGITVTDRYLKTYLEFFSSSTSAVNTDITPAPLITPAPSH